MSGVDLSKSTIPKVFNPKKNDFLQLEALDQSNPGINGKVTVAHDTTSIPDLFMLTGTVIKPLSFIFELLVYLCCTSYLSLACRLYHTSQY